MNIGYKRFIFVHYLVCVYNKTCPCKHENCKLVNTFTICLTHIRFIFWDYIVLYK